MCTFHIWPLFWRKYYVVTIIYQFVTREGSKKIKSIPGVYWKANKHTYNHLIWSNIDKLYIVGKLYVCTFHIWPLFWRKYYVVFIFFKRYKSILFLMLVYVLKKKENMQHMTSGTHTINRSHQPCVDVTPPGPHHHTERVSNPGLRCGRQAL